VRARLGKCVIGRRAAESPVLACAATPDEDSEFAASLGERGTNKKTSFPGTRRPRLATSHTSRAYSSRGVGARARPDERGEAARTPHRSPDVPDAPVGGIDTDPASPGDSWQTRHARENARTMPSVVRRPSSSAGERRSSDLSLPLERLCENAAIRPRTSGEVRRDATLLSRTPRGVRSMVQRRVATPTVPRSPSPRRR